MACQAQQGPASQLPGCCRRLEWRQRARLPPPHLAATCCSRHGGSRRCSPRRRRGARRPCSGGGGAAVEEDLRRSSRQGAAEWARRRRWRAAEAAEFDSLTASFSSNRATRLRNFCVPRLGFL